MDEHLFAIDRIEDNVVVLENIKTKEKKEVDREILPNSIHEGSVVKFDNNCYILEEKEEEKRRQEILEKFKKLRKNV